MEPSPQNAGNLSGPRVKRLWVLVSIVGTFIAGRVAFLGNFAQFHDSTLWPDHKSLAHTNADKPMPNGAQDAEFLSVIVWLPSAYSDADIYVDGSEALVTGRDSSFVTLRVTKQNRPHVFEFEKGSVTNKETLLVLTNDTIIKPFAY